MSRKKDLPLVAIVGRPNVGKSTLFNHLTGSRRAIVGDEPGITRDRLYGEVEWLGRKFRVVDTGGIIPDDKDFIPSEIFRQAKVAFEEASAIIMVVDARTEIAGPDRELARLLARTGKPLFLGVNKMDSDKQDSLLGEFHSLGIRNVFPISAEHGRGIDDLLDAVLEVIPNVRVFTTEDTEGTEVAEGTEDVRVFTTEDTEDTEVHDDTENTEDTEVNGRVFTTEDTGGTEVAEQTENIDDTEVAEDTDVAEATGGKVKGSDKRTLAELHEIRVAIIGHPNVGKSTLLNQLTGIDRAIVSPIAGTTRDSIDQVIRSHGRDIRFVDTAGIRRKGKTHLMAEKLSVVMARKNIEDADIVLFMVDATEGVSGLDANIAGYAHESGRSVIILVNKWDLISTGQKRAVSQSKTARIQDAKRPHDRALYEERLRYGLKFLSYAPVLFISAHTGKGTEKIIPMIEKVAAERRKRISTGEMNRFIRTVDFERASVPMSKRVRILYMTQAGVAPPTFVLFTDRAVKLHFAYQRFLENQIREAFGFVGSPIWIKNRARN